jgi:tetratricopeptide (TPR) repeat protein
MFDPDQPQQLQTDDFVNRGEHLDGLRKMVAGENPCRIYLVRGREGIGKSYLLKEFQAQCRAAGVPCTNVLGGASEDTSYLSIAAYIWEDLRLGSPEDLHQQIAQALAAQHIQVVSLPEVQPGQSALTFTGDTKIIGPVITGDVKGKVDYKPVIQMVLNDHPKARAEVLKIVTALLKARLVDLTTQQRAVFLIDPWETACSDDQTSAWLLDTLISWILEGVLPGAVLAVAGHQPPLLTRLIQHIHHTELGTLDDDAVHTYWVEKCRLPPADLHEVLNITNGIPEVLSLTAARAAYAGRLAANPIPSTPDPTNITGYAVEGLLAVIPAPLAQAVRLCAVPSWFDRELFNALVGPSPDLFDQLVSLRFVECERENVYSLGGSVRRYLLDRWWQPENRQQYVEKSRIVLEYLQRPVRSPSSLRLWSLELEIAYFRLVVDEARGLAALCEHFEAALQNRQLDLAEQYLHKAQELEGILTPPAQAWLRYLAARLLLAKGQTAPAKAALDDLPAADPVLQAAISWTNGRLLVQQRQWSQAALAYKAALDLLDRQPSPLYALMVRLSVARAYEDLADASGGLHQEGGRFAAARRSLLNTIQQLPFLAVEWLVHRWSFMPNWYFGANYQDWIISYLLMESARWYRLAQAALQPDMDPLWAFEIQLGLAGVEHQLGRWSKVHKHYDTLYALDLVQQSPYRRALVDLGSGQALAAERRFDAALEALERALPALDHFHDYKRSGAVRACLSQVYAELGRFDLAAQHGIASVTDFQQAGKPIQAAQMIFILEDLHAAHDLGEMQAPVEAQINGAGERHYLLRFPDALLHWYRKMAGLVALPLTYFAAILLSLVAVFVIAIVEGEMELSIINLTTILAYALISIVIIIPLTLWIYRLIYSIVGLAVVSRLGRALAPIEAAQPRLFITTPDGLHYPVKPSGAYAEVCWSDIRQVGFDTYRLVHREINLFSRTILLPAGGRRPPVEIDAVAGGYAHLKQDILRRLQAAKVQVDTIRADYQVFNWRWIAASAVFALVVTAFLAATNRLCGTYTDTTTNLDAATIVGPAALNLLLTFTLAMTVQIAWRALGHSLQVSRRLGHTPGTFPTWQRWLAALFTLAVFLLWLLRSLGQEVCAV